MTDNQESQGIEFTSHKTNATSSTFSFQELQGCIVETMTQSSTFASWLVVIGHDTTTSGERKILVTLTVSNISTSASPNMWCNSTEGDLFWFEGYHFSFEMEM